MAVATAAHGTDYVGPGGLIPDGSGNLTTVINITDSFIIADVSITLTGLSHTWCGDLVATLIKMDTGETQKLFDRIGKTNATTGFGSSSNFSGAYTFEDGGADIWTAAAATPVPPGTYAATGPLSSTPVSLVGAFGGISATGMWKLIIEDKVASDVGSLGSWTLSFDKIIPDPKLTLEGVDCQDDVKPLEPGHQIEVKLWMRDLTQGPVTGFQAFVDYDDSLLDYRGDLSSYTLDPFELHIIPVTASEYAAGRLVFDGSDDFDKGGTTDDSALVCLVFDVLDECATTDIDFDLLASFESELSFQGLPLVTELVDSGPLRLDDTPPVIVCPDDIKVAAQLNIPLPLCSATDCCVAHAGTGCSDANCTTIVCTEDPFCCGSSWDSICANEAVSFCPPTVPGGPCVGAIVDFTVPASDNCEPPAPTIVCVPPSGSIFPIGVTPVTCTATDDCGKTASCLFLVDVNPTNAAYVDIKLWGSLAADRCIHFQTDDCSAAADATLSFTADGFGSAVFAGFVEVPCGDWTSLCAKDEQHTKWATVGLTRFGPFWAVDSQIVLLPGDDDNDGDVDINDVTWLTFTFGDFAADGGCPYDGFTRDADFNNGGAVQSEDYSLLSGQFLTMSSCACTSPALGGPPASFDTRVRLTLDEVHPAIRNQVDRNGDGVFDATDVGIFEKLHGLPDTLSSKMRAIERNR